MEKASRKKGEALYHQAISKSEILVWHIFLEDPEEQYSLLCYRQACIRTEAKVIEKQ